MKFISYKSIFSAFLAGILLLGSGCSQFLEELDPSNLTPESYYTKPEHAEAAVAAVYASLRFTGGAAGASFSANWQMLEAVSGTAASESAENINLNNLLALVYDGYNAHVVNWWNGLYLVIAQANLAIEKIPGITPMDEAQKTRLLGEAKFMRAWAYFNAVRLWGDVPLITLPQTASSADFNPSRTSQEAVYALILEDLLAAESAGLPWMDVSGRVCAAAVKAQLSRVYLTMAGFPLKKGTSHYTLAAAKAKGNHRLCQCKPFSDRFIPNLCCTAQSGE